LERFHFRIIFLNWMSFNSKNKALFNKTGDGHSKLFQSDDE